MCAAVVAGGYTSPVFELGEHVFDFVALSVEGLVVGDCGLTILVDGMQGSIPRSIRACRNQLLS